jgi:methyl-accepting chemotaxis protein
MNVLLILMPALRHVELVDEADQLAYAASEIIMATQHLSNIAENLKETMSRFKT